VSYKLILLFATFGISAAAAPKPAAPKAKAKTAAAVAAAKPSPAANVTSMKRALASTGSTANPGDPLKNDPNKALEVRGQSRTLSMMLVLKNGKEGINFIKVRESYRPEITSTPY
jgi:hypothetical protein